MSSNTKFALVTVRRELNGLAIACSDLNATHPEYHFDFYFEQTIADEDCTKIFLMVIKASKTGMLPKLCRQLQPTNIFDGIKWKVPRLEPDAEPKTEKADA